MENEQQEPQEMAQQDADKKVDVPQEVKTSEFTQDEANDARKQHLDMLEKGKETAKKYGEPDMQSFLAKVASDGIFAQRVVEDLVGGLDSGAKSTVHPESPQERNIVGRIDRTVDTPTKLKVEGQTELPPVVK